MAAQFPTTLPTIQRLAANDKMNDPGKEGDVLHNKLADEVEALAASVGIAGSAVAGSVQKRLGDLELVAPGTPGGLVAHAADHAAMGIFNDAAPGACVTLSERNISHTTKTKILLPNAPLQLAILWVESGTSGNLKFVLEAASSLDADSRLANDAAHGEISSGSSILIRFIPSTSPMYIYLLATSAVGAGSNLATIIAKVTE